MLCDFDCTITLTTTIDIRDLITVDEIMDELAYGPNGGLVYAMEYLIPLYILLPLSRRSYHHLLLSLNLYAVHLIAHTRLVSYPFSYQLFDARRYLVENMEWFLEELGDFDDDYLIIDCPGNQFLILFI